MAATPVLDSYALIAFLRGEPVPLDFDKVRRDLATQQPMTRCLLLQALRFRLSIIDVGVDVIEQ